MNIKIFKSIEIEDVADQLRSFKIQGIVKFNHTTSGFDLITIPDESKAFSFDLDGNVRIGNNQAEKEFVINFEEAK
jgi:hypothetical protein